MTWPPHQRSDPSQTDEPSDASEVDRAIVESYERVPQEVIGGDWAVQQAILDEPWPTRPNRTE